MPKEPNPFKIEGFELPVSKKGEADVKRPLTDREPPNKQIATREKGGTENQVLCEILRKY